MFDFWEGTFLTIRFNISFLLAPDIIKGRAIWRLRRPGLWTTMTNPIIMLMEVRVFSYLADKR
jgi:hypothetical protein